jgi:hypothetical protein
MLRRAGARGRQCVLRERCRGEVQRRDRLRVCFRTGKISIHKSSLLRIGDDTSRARASELALRLRSGPISVVVARHERALDTGESNGWVFGTISATGW